jgi:hypothetical protein
VTFDPSSYVPEPNEWLDLPTEQRGRAELHFRDPAGSVGGDAELSVDETGEVRIEVRLDPATLKVESGTGEGLLPFIQPRRSKVVDGRDGRRISINSFGRVAIRHLVRAGSDARTIDEQIAYLCRCLDSLCKRFEVDQQKLRASLTEQELDDVTNALDAASGVIRPLADNARASVRTDAARVLNRIAERARQASNLEKQFGLAVVDLLRVPRISLPDADIVDAYYAANPHRAGTRSWSSVLSTYRGDVIHHGYIPFSEGERDAEDVVRVVRHLYDVTVRVIFKILEYNGKYRPRISPSTKKVDWVDATTTPEDLGFR